MIVYIISKTKVVEEFKQNEDESKIYFYLRDA
jgi:hypothetical protein